MKHLSAILTLLLSFCCIVSCAQGKTDKATNVKEANSMNTGNKVLVAFFSRTRENYAVGEITKGNTHIIAEMIAESTGGRQRGAVCGDKGGKRPTPLVRGTGGRQTGARDDTAVT